VGQDLLIVEATRSLSGLSHSVELLWSGQHTALTTHRHPCSRGIRTRNPNKQAAADPRFRPRGHWIGLKKLLK